MNPPSKHTPLYEEHRLLKAHMVSFAGWVLPLNYPSGTLKEHMAVRNAAGIFDVSHMGRVTLLGERVGECLDYLTPSRISTLGEGQAKYTVFLNDEGGVIDDLIIYKRDEREFRIIWNAANHEKNLRHLAPYLERYYLTLSDVTQETALIALQGPRALEIVRRLGFPIPGERFLWEESESPAGTLMIARTGYTGEDGVEFWIPRNRAPTLWRSLCEEGATPCGLAARDSLRIEAGFPLYGNELSEEIDPFSGGIGFVVARGKTGYLGFSKLQERIAHKSPPILYGLVSRSRVIPRQGYKLLDRSWGELGVITSGSFSPLLGSGIGLARVYRNIREGEEVIMEGREKREPVVLLRPPLYRSSQGISPRISLPAH